MMAHVGFFSDFHVSGQISLAQILAIYGGSAAGAEGVTDLHD